MGVSDSKAMGTSDSKRWQTHGNVAQWVSAVVASLALLIAAAAVFGAYRQINAIRENGREMGAKQVWRSYLELAIQNPKLVEPDYTSIKAKSGEEFIRYRYFVGHLLYGCEEILASFPSDRGWDHACRNELWSHRAYLCEYMKGEFFEEFDRNTQSFLLSLIDAAKTSETPPPECGKNPS
jgi:hypothetical protein